MFGYKKMYIGGQLIDGSENEKMSVICPANEEVIGEIAWGNKEDTLKALEDAQKGFTYWSNLSGAERKEWMLKLREAIIEEEELIKDIISHEVGKPLKSAWGEFYTMCESLRFFAQEIDNISDQSFLETDEFFEHTLVKVPIGVVVAFLAWNYPFMNAGYKIGPTLAAGCSLIIRPSKETPLSAYLLGEICHKINFPEGVINIICGPHESVGDTLAESKMTAGITLIGSVQTGVNLLKKSATSIKHYSMELGGNAPLIIFEDADLGKAIQLTALMKFGNTGQVCVAPNRVFVHKSKMDAYINGIESIAKSIKIGFGKDPDIAMGPLINEKARNRVDRLVKNAIKDGAQLIYGGKIPEDFNTGYYYMPTILRDVTPQMRIYKEEVFGPIISIIEFEDEDEVINMANDTEAGLSSYLFTKDHDRIVKFTKKLEFGEVQVNGFKMGINLPPISELNKVVSVVTVLI